MKFLMQKFPRFFGFRIVKLDSQLLGILDNRLTLRQVKTPDGHRIEEKRDRVQIPAPAQFIYGNNYDNAYHLPTDLLLRAQRCHKDERKRPTLFEAVGELFVRKPKWR